MDFDLGKAWHSVKEGTKEIAETAHVKTKEFHKNYVSKVIPDCGKYGDTARFVAEMAPGVSEYNAIIEGDWTEFAIAAGIDVGAHVIGACTAGAGYAAIKGGSVAAKTGTKIAVKEVAEAGTKKVVKKMAEESVEKVTKEVVGEVTEEGTEKIAKEAVKVGAKKEVKEVTEESIEKTVKELADKPEVLDKAISQIEKNKLDGIAREEKVLEELVSKFGNKNVIREALIRDVNGIPIKDVITNEARRIDFVVKEGDRILRSIEVTSETAPKTLQTAKELRILEQAKDLGGAFIKDPNTGELIKFDENLVTDIRRLP